MALSACSSVEIHDSEWCGQLPDGSAICFWMLNPKTRDVPKVLWDMERVGEVCAKASAFADIKAEIEKLCHITGKCTQTVKDQVTKFFDNVDALSKVKPLPSDGIPTISISE